LASDEIIKRRLKFRTLDQVLEQLCNVAVNNEIDQVSQLEDYEEMVMEYAAFALERALGFQKKESVAPNSIAEQKINA
jgi:hypothetical protein